jgi:EAL domain-containing protein (putative c-di-GMP-specific phosphodiesterase class I)
LLADLGRPALFDELVLHYQPTFDLRDGTIEGVEALLRWQHPRHGLLAPGTFIAAAEESGAIVGIGRWVLRTACREAAGWAVLADSPPVVAVNVSGRQLREPAFIEEVRAALFESGLSAPALRIELTESVLIHANETARENLAKVSELGVELAIDDFGTAHSWIGNLQQLAPDVLKIDRSFMVGIEQEDSPLLRAILALSRELDLKVIAEGIETEDQLKIVRRLHCHAGQGFHLSRPVPAEDITALLRHAHRVPGVGLRAV